MMDICVIGAGITGLSVARLLSKKHVVTVLEKESEIGGIARTKNINGVPYHLVGGHCFNSKHKDVISFVFNEIYHLSNWNFVKRDAKIYLRKHNVSYPIEFSIKEISKFDQDLALEMANDFLFPEEKVINNLADWFECTFGKTLADEYFIPYNRKIWQMEPSRMSHLWVVGKLPQPNKREFIQALISHNIDTMPHSSFYYPKSDNQNPLIHALSSGLNIIKDFEVKKMSKVNGRWSVNNKLTFDLVINTMPLNILPSVLSKTPNRIKEEAKKLKYNKITNMLWRTKPVKPTWTYYPASDTIFHRHIHIGNFLNKSRNYTITESMGVHSYEEMCHFGKKNDYLVEPLDYNISDYAYVVYDHNYKESTKKIKEYLSSIGGLYTLGRFGEWGYHNMDICMKNAIDLSVKLNKI